MDRFAYVRKFCIYAKFAYVCKSGHVCTALDSMIPLLSKSEISSLWPSSVAVHIDGIHQPSYKIHQSVKLHFFTPFFAPFAKILDVSKIYGIGLIELEY